MKKLNNKGFTLVELLAVVVILAVVMGIAMTSVITAMNNSRKGSLEDSAVSVERAFQTKYSEAQVTGGIGSLFSDVDSKVSYNFSGSAVQSGHVIYPISNSDKIQKNLNMSSNTYKMSSDIASTNAPSTSFVAFNGDDMVVCLVAVPAGSYYVKSAALKVDKIVKIFDEVEVTFKANDMFSCSNGENSWETSSSSLIGNATS